MEYAVIVERKNGIYKAVIPNLPALSAEGASSDEAVRNVQQVARDYLATVEIRKIQLELPQPYSTAQDWIAAAGIFSPEDELYQQYRAEIESERNRQYEEANREMNQAESE